MRKVDDIAFGSLIPLDIVQQQKDYLQKVQQRDVIIKNQKVRLYEIIDVIAKKMD